MLQISKNTKTGELLVENIPAPALFPCSVCVRNVSSLISAGTEKTIVESTPQSIINRVSNRPDLVKKVFARATKEGWIHTLKSVTKKSDKHISLGYSAAGIIEKIGCETHNFKLGDRVAIGGAGYANHAEVNCVPQNLVSLIPDSVSFEEAAYTTVGSIAMQGVRITKPQIEDYVVVSGLGLIGNITMQILKANGCRVIGIDIDQAKIDLALKLGMDFGINLTNDDPIQSINEFTKGRFADHTIITAATKSNAPIELAGKITRRKGQVIVVGAVGLNIPREIFYQKELEIKISMSYGPGRYDFSYEEGGIDYPYDYVRWTERRNMESILSLIEEKKLNVKALTTHKFNFENATDAYDLIKSGKEPYIGIILEYDSTKENTETVYLNKEKTPQIRTNKETLTIGFVGAGNYASASLLPHLIKNSRVDLKGLVSSSGLNAKQKAEKFKFGYFTTSYSTVVNDDSINSIFIGTRHSTHALFAIEALSKHKNVFVEKPVVVNKEQLLRLINAYNIANEKEKVGLMVGLNRRFAPMVIELKNYFNDNRPMQMIYRVNSGHIPTNSWTHFAEEGGGMLVSEMCHFIDLMQFMCGNKPVSVFASTLSLNNTDIEDSDNIVIVIQFEKGSVGTLNYNTIGSRAYSKERLEIYSSSKVGILDNFKTLELTVNDKLKSIKSTIQDKGQENQIKSTIDSFLAGESPIPFEQIVDGILVVFAAQRSIQTGLPVKLSNVLTE